MKFSNYGIANTFVKASILRAVRRLRQAYYVALYTETPIQTAWNQAGS